MQLIPLIVILSTAKHGNSYSKTYLDQDMYISRNPINKSTLVTTDMFTDSYLRKTILLNCKHPLPGPYSYFKSMLLYPKGS